MTHKAYLIINLLLDIIVTILSVSELEYLETENFNLHVGAPRAVMIEVGINVVYWCVLRRICNIVDRQYDRRSSHCYHVNFPLIELGCK